MAEGKKVLRAAARPKGRAAFGNKAQRRKIEAGMEALYDVLALQEGRPRDPTRIDRRLHELRAVVFELLGRVPVEVEQAIDQFHGAVSKLAPRAQPLMEEAKALFAAVDDAELPTIERYVAEHPPSAAVIGFLVLIVRAEALSESARRAAEGTHEEDSALRSQAIAYYVAHRSEYQNKDSAAEDIAKNIVPAKQATVRRWLRNI